MCGTDPVTGYFAKKAGNKLQESLTPKIPDAPGIPASVSEAASVVATPMQTAAVLAGDALSKNRGRKAFRVDISSKAPAAASRSGLAVPGV